MKTQNNIRRRILVASLAAFLSVFSGLISNRNVVVAASEPTYRLQISPLQLALGTIKPGHTYRGQFSVQNPGSEPYEFKTEIIPYSVTGQDYDADFVTMSNHTAMVDWITITDNATGTVNPNSQVIVKFKIDVPEDAAGGSQGAAIATSLVDNSSIDASGVQTLNRIAYFFYGNVDGDTRATGEVISNKVPTLLFTPPVVATSVVKNTGNIYTEAKYKLEVFNLFGGREIYSNVKYENGEETVDTHVIFPDTERYSELAWGETPPIGIFKVRQTITIFDEESKVEKLVIVCPIWLLILILMFIGTAVFWIVSRIQHRKKD